MLFQNISHIYINNPQIVKQILSNNLRLIDSGYQLVFYKRLIIY